MSERAVLRARGLSSLVLMAAFITACTGSAPSKPGGGAGAGGRGGAAGHGGSGGSLSGGAGTGGSSVGASGGDTSGGSGSAGTAGSSGGASGSGIGGTNVGGAGAASAGGMSGAGAGPSGASGGSGAVGGAGAAAGSAGGPLAFDVSTAANPVAPNGRLLYTITVGNVSTHAVDGVTVTLLLPIGLQFHYTYDSEPNSSACAGSATCSANGQATWTLGSLAAGTSRTIELNAQILQTVGSGDTISAAFKLGATGVNTITFTKTVQVYTQSAAQLSTGTATYPLLPGQRFTLDLDVGQLGGTALTGASLQATIASGLTVVSMSDGGVQSATGVVSWTLGGVGVGAALHRQIDVTVDAGVPEGSILRTTANLTYDGGLAVDAAAEYAVVVASVVPSLSASVAATQNPVVPGGRVSYAVTVTNLATRAVDGISVRLRVPTGLQFHYTYDADPNSSACAGSATCAANSEAVWTIGTLNAGASQNIVVNPQVLANTVGNGNLIRSLFAVVGTGVDEVDVVKTVQVFDSPGAQLALTATANPVTNAQAFTYNFDIGQIGVTALTGAELHAHLPPGLTVGAVSDGGTQPSAGEIVWTIGGIAVGADLHRTVTVTGGGSAPPGTILGARASLTFDGGATVDNLTEYNIPVVSAAPIITLNVTGTPSPVVPGARLLYTATITNTSARSVDGVQVLLRVPTGLQFHYTNDADPDSSACAGSATCAASSEALWSLGTMAAGAIQMITINAQVLTGLLSGSLIAAPFSLNATGMEAPLLRTIVVPAHM